MHSICRTCLCEIADDNRLVLTEDTKSLRVKTELSACVPEIVVDKVINPVVCFKCVDALHSAYEFKMQCLQTEVRINNYMENMNSDVNCDSPTQKIIIEHFQFRTAPRNKTSKASLKPSTSDIIDDLNSLLDEALLNVPKSCAILEDKNQHVEYEDDFFNQHVTEPYKYTGGEDQKPIILGNGIVLKECFVVCEKLPPNVVNSKLSVMSTQNTPPQRGNPKRNRQLELLECTLCPYKTRHSGTLKVHEKIHTMGTNYYVCDICYYCCPIKANFDRHMTTHSDVKPFTCEVCPYKCGYAALLRRHMRNIHKLETGCKLFSCSKCPFKSTTEQAVKTHTANLHENFHENLHENIHENLHEKLHENLNESQLFSCKLCAYQSAYRHNLKRHVAKHHVVGQP